MPLQRCCGCAKPSVSSRRRTERCARPLGTRCGYRLAGDNRALRNIDRFKALPIIVVCYKDRPEDQQKTLEAVADRYVTKPEFDTDAMLDLVAELLRT